MTNITQRIAVASSLIAPRVTLIDETSGSALLEQLMSDELALYAAIELARIEIDSAHTRLGVGGQRRVWRGPGCVYKLPLVTREFRRYLTNRERYLTEYYHPVDIGDFEPAENVRANLNEVLAYETDAMLLPLAPCRLAWHESGIPLVVMERLDMRRRGRPYVGDMHNGWDDEYEQCQVGWSHMLGSWAGFDAGLPPDRALMSEIKWHKHLVRRRKGAFKRMEREAARAA